MHVVVVMVIVLLTGCSTVETQPLYQTADSLGSYQQPSFPDYVDETTAWLEKNRVYLTPDKQKEIASNAPFELRPDVPTRKGVLLVHGLGDSPYSFIDIAQSLVKAGYRVRTILLPGHGSKPGDLMLPTLDDWQGVVSHHTQLLAQTVDELWLGGFSTGANLVTVEALRNDAVDGLLLFSPAFKPKSAMVGLAPLMAKFVDWAMKDDEDNYVRYESLPMNGAAVYYQTSKAVREALKKRQFDKPVYIAMSEADSVIDTDTVIELFEQRFVHPASQLLWYGETNLDSSRGQLLSMRLPQFRISTGSHMGLLFAPENAHYGIQGAQRVCDNGFRRSDIRRCLAGEEVWFSAWGYAEEDKIHARLTWNPYYDLAKARMLEVMTGQGVYARATSQGSRGTGVMSE